MNEVPIVLITIPIDNLKGKYIDTSSFLEFNQQIESNSDYYYITDPKQFNKLSTGVNYKQLWCEDCKKIEDNFVHYGTNSLSFELYCVLRWFLLRNFMIQNQLESAICIDNDVLFLSPITQWPQEIKAANYTLSYGCSPHLNFINSLHSLKSFCNFCFGIYVDRNEEMQHIQKTAAERAKENLNFSINDMVLWSKFFNKFPEERGVRDISKINETNETFDHNINHLNLGAEYQGSNLCKFSKHDIFYKKINFTEEGAYCFTKSKESTVFSKTRIHSLHLQGGTKGLMPFIKQAFIDQKGI
jgi:hypothetical protein